MSSTLSEGVRVPDIGSTSWGADVNFNWGLLNTALANISGNVKVDVANTWTATQTFTETISGSIDGVAARAVGDEDGNNIKTALASKAADNTVVHLAGAETITGNKAWTGSNAFNSILPNATSTYSLGSSSYQWSSVYAQTYYYNGTAWGLDKVNEWTDTNTFSKTNSDTIQLKNGRVAIGETLSSDAYTQLVFKDKNADNLAYIRDYYIANGENSLYFYVRNKYSSGSPSTTGSVVYTFFGLSLDNTGKSYARLKGDFYPYTNNLYSLGTSTNKWKTLNGINPGALSLPKNANNASFNIDTTNWTTDGSIIVYTPLLDGWIYINARNDDTNGDSFIIFDDSVSGFGTSVFGNKGLANSGAGLLCLMMPVNKNNGVNIRIKSPGIVSAKLYPCNGNV